MKKLLSVILAAALLLGCCGSAAADAQDAGMPEIPAAGEVIHGFEVKEIREYQMYGAQLVLFEHQQTGAKVLWIANDDTNRGFELSFPTRPADNTGLPHVFEHATLYGSEKYPASSLFFNVSYQTYNTYINAHTTDACTAYPLASLSEVQLLALADYYVDSCFHPMIMTDESIFRTQAWHYDMADADANLTYEGVVYSEMLGALTLKRTALDNANRVTFPGSALAYNYGGLPENIPDLTWEDVKSFHDKYYHPSNCFAILYGKLGNYRDFLQLLDAEFSQYERKEFTFEQPGYTRITESVTSEVPYPAAEGMSTAGQSVIYYYILCPGLKEDAEQERLVDHVTAILNHSGSVLSRKMREQFPGSSVSCGREVAGPEDAIVFVANGMNKGDGEAFKALVDESLATVAAEGFPQDMVDSALSTLRISTKLGREDTDPVESVMYGFEYDYAVSGNPFKHAEDEEAYERIGEENEKGLLRDAAAAWLTGDVLYTLTTTYPAPGEREKLDAALEEKLAAIKAGMSEEELQAVIDATNDPGKPEDTSELIAKIKAVTVESLPEEIKIYPITDETDESGIRHIDVTAEVNGIGNIRLMLDAAALPPEDLHWMQLYTRILGRMDTDMHTADELDVLLTRYLYDYSIRPRLLETEGGAHPYMGITWTSLDEDLADGYNLAEEILFRTQFTDTERLRGLITEQINNVRADINNNPYQVMLYRGVGQSTPVYALYSYLNYIEYYDFLLRLDAQMEEDPEAAVAKLQEIQGFFRNNAGAVAAFAGNGESIALNRPLADAFMAGLDHVEREPAVYELPAASRREALIIDGSTHFNCVIASSEEMGLEEPDYALNAVAALVSDTILVPVLREQMGIYTPWNSLMDNGCMYLITYRDPGIRETFNVYAQLADLIAELDVDQDTLDGYIMSEYSLLAGPVGELSGASEAVVELMEGKGPERKLTWMRQLKALTPETVKAAAEFYRSAWENGVHSTAGSAAKVNEAAELYEVILNPFNTVAPEDVEFTDVPEDYEYYAGVHFAVTNGLMAPVSETEFGAENPATAGELLSGLSTILFGTALSAEETRDTLAEYQLIAPDFDTEQELTEQVLCDILAPLGVGLTTDTPDAVMPRGELADLLMQLSQ